MIPFARPEGADGAVLLATAEPWRLALFEDLERRARCRFAPRFLDERPLALALERLLEIPADPRHHVQPRRRRSEAVAAANAERARVQAEVKKEEPELMSESAFEEFHQR